MSRSIATFDLAQTLDLLDRTPAVVDGRRPGALVIPGAKYGRTDLVARDGRALATFYEQVFGCVDGPATRNRISVGEGTRPK